MTAFTKTSLIDMSRSSNMLGLLALIAFLVTVTTKLAFSPLRRFPGPLAARFSSFWLADQCRRTRRSKAVMELHQKYGDFVRIASNHISINHPAAVQDIYGHKSGFAKSDFYDAFLQLTPVVFNVREVESHQRKRKYINPAFSTRSLLKFESHMDAEILAWKRQILNIAQKGSTIDFTVWTNYLAFDVIGSFAFGRSFGFIEKGQDPYNLIATIDARGEVLNALGSLPKWIRPWMKYNYFDEFWSKGLRATANLERIGRNAYQERANSTKDREDLLSYLFKARDITSKLLDEREIVAESISFIVGGSDTTSSTMTNAIDIISRRPELQIALQTELDTAFLGEQSEDWVPSDQVVQSLPLLVATLREVMRIRPTSATGLARIVPPGGRTIAGTYIPGETVVSVPTCGLLNDSRVYENPDEFNPQRWLVADTKELVEYFLPFSTGPRACIGRNFAWMEILKSLAVIFKVFNVHRAITKPTVIREGFFNKAVECNCYLKRRV